VAQLFVDLLAAPAVAQGDGHGALGGWLPDDVVVELGDDFLGGHGHGQSASTVWFMFV
jgi:hypothetical protein